MGTGAKRPCYEREKHVIKKFTIVRAREAAETTRRRKPSKEGKKVESGRVSVSRRPLL